MSLMNFMSGCVHGNARAGNEPPVPRPSFDKKQQPIISRF